MKCCYLYVILLCFSVFFFGSMTYGAGDIDLSGETVNKQKVDIADYKGKVVLVDVWATWCGPCIKETPRIKSLYNKYNKHGFDVVGVSCDKNKDSLVSYLNRNKLPWKTLYTQDGNSAFVRANGIRGIPHFILIGANGKVVKRDLASQQLDFEISKALGLKQQIVPRVQTRIRKVF